MSATILEPPLIDLEHLTGPEPTVLEGVSWDDYEALDRRRDLLERHFRLAYFDGVLEIMPPPISDEHEGRSDHLGHLIGEFCMAKEIEFWGRGTKTLRSKPLAAREPDEQFYLREKGEFPDLVVEVAISTRASTNLRLTGELRFPKSGSGATISLKSTG